MKRILESCHRLATIPPVLINLYVPLYLLMAVCIDRAGLPSHQAKFYFGRTFTATVNASFMLTSVLSILLWAAWLLASVCGIILFGGNFILNSSSCIRLAVSFVSLVLAAVLMRTMS